MIGTLHSAFVRLFEQYYTKQTHTVTYVYVLHVITSEALYRLPTLVDAYHVLHVTSHPPTRFIKAVHTLFRRIFNEKPPNNQNSMQ